MCKFHMYARRFASWFLIFVVFFPALLSGSAPAKRSCAGLLDLAGKDADPFAAQHDRGLVFVFTRVDCPIANSYAPEVQRLAKQYSEKGVSFRLIYCDPDESSATVQKHLAEYRYDIGALRDPKREFARFCHVKVTPEAAVFLPDGKLVYHGRIDDRYADLGKSRPEARQHDLARAIDSLLAGQSVPAAGGAAVGCMIEGL